MKAPLFVTDFLSALRPCAGEVTPAAEPTSELIPAPDLWFDAATGKIVRGERPEEPHPLDLVRCGW